MTTFLQMHFLTAYPASNLNRDDTGRPKTVDFGGTTRLRISSQSLKRAWRGSPVFQKQLEGHLGKRTQRLGDLVRAHLQEKGMSDEKAVETARAIAGVFGKLAEEKAEKKSTKKGDKREDGGLKLPSTDIKQLAFVSPDELSRALALADRAMAGEDIDVKAADVLNRVDAAADIAMFGRMLADNPSFNRDAAVQVAHAMTTHGVAVDDDYYVAVDDLKNPALRDEDAGSSFIGNLEFGAGVFYTYVCINCDQLKANLDGDAAVARAAIAALVEAATTISPSGKQNSFASRARASFVLLERGNQQPRTLANAFLRALSDGEQRKDAMESSRARLMDLQQKMDEAYGACADARTELYVTPDRPLNGSLSELIQFGEASVA